MRNRCPSSVFLFVLPSILSLPPDAPAAEADVHSESRFEGASVVCLWNTTSIEVSSDATRAIKTEEARYVIRRESERVNRLRDIELTESRESHPVDAWVQVRNRAGVALTRRIEDFGSIPTFYEDVDFRSLQLRLPPLRGGDTLEVKLKTRNEPFMGFPVHTFGDIAMPVALEVFEVTIPNSLSPRHARWNGLDLPEEERTSDRIHWMWKLQNLLPVNFEEEFVPLGDRPTVSIGVSRIAWGPAGTWEELAATYWNRASHIMNEGRDGVDTGVGGRSPVADLLTYVQDHIRFASAPRGRGSRIPSFTAGTINRRQYGDAKDMSVLMVTLLRQNGVTADMALVCTREVAGLKVDPLPTLEFFNHTIAFARSEGAELWLDASNPFSTTRTPPPDIQGAPALIVSGPEAGYRRIPYGTAAATSQNSSFTITRSGKGGGTSVLDLSYSGAAAVAYRSGYSTPRRARRAIENYLNRFEPPIDSSAVVWNQVRVQAVRRDSFFVHIPLRPSWLPVRGNSGQSRPAWLRDPIPTFIGFRRQQDVYWPFCATATDTFTFVSDDWAGPGVPDTTWTTSLQGVQFRVEQRSRPGGYRLIRSFIVDNLIYPAARWHEAHDLRERSIRWSTRELPAGSFREGER